MGIQALQTTHAAAAQAAANLNLPPGALAGILTDVLDLLKKYLPTLLGTAPGGVAQAHVTAMESEFAAYDQARALPPGTILKLLGTLLPVIGQVLAGLGGLGGAGTAAAGHVPPPCTAAP